MTDTLTPPADWREATLSLSRAPSGTLEGTLTISAPELAEGHRTFRLANWRREASEADVTVIRCHVTMRGCDPWLDSWLARIGARVAG